MRIGRVLLLTLVLVSFGAASVFADDVYQNFRAKTVQVTVNGKTLQDSGLLLSDGKSMLPLRELADTLQALVKWDDEKQAAQIYKPNVHVFPIKVSKNKIVPFGTVYKGKYDFVLQTQVDSLQTSISSLKVNIVDPYGSTVYSYIYDDQLKDVGEEFWVTTETISLDFKYVGKYTIKVFMKMDKDGEYSLVSEKIIRSKSE